MIKTISHKLEVSLNRCLGKILNLFWPNTTSNTELHRRTATSQEEEVAMNWPRSANVTYSPTQSCPQMDPRWPQEERQTFVLSRLDYCNALLSRVPQYLLDRLQRVQNAAARLIVKASISDHITPILHSLHWLPVAARIQYKVFSLCYSSLSVSGPEYLSRVLRIYTPSRQLRSSSDNRILCVPSAKTKTFGQRSFSYAGPVIWNKLPYDIRSSQSKTSLKQAPKTNLFSTHY